MINLVIVMFIGGLWHGAAWTFVVWGLLHGSYLAIERLLKATVKDTAWTQTWPVKLLLGAVTYVAVLIAWVYFRASDFTTAGRLIHGMFGGHPHPDAILSTREILQVMLVTLGLLIAHWSMRDSSLEAVVAKLPRWTVTGAWFFMAGAIVLTQGNSNAFIYFQF
jgi:alginate O-acetyltransferase complex protein AlgI